MMNVQLYIDGQDVNNGNTSMLSEDVKAYYKSPANMVEASLESIKLLLIFIPTLICNLWDQARQFQTRNRVLCLCDCD